MYKIFMGGLAIVFPWISMLINDNPGGAIVALVLQGSILGWPVASVWAFKIEMKKWDEQDAEKKIKNKKAS